MQESVFERFIAKLKTRMNTLRIGSSLDKCVDVGAVIDENQKATIDAYVRSAVAEGAEVRD